MVNDILSTINCSLVNYATSIAQSSDQNLRQTLQQIRNADEQFQCQLYKMAEQKAFTSLQSRQARRKSNR